MRGRLLLAAVCTLLPAQDSKVTDVTVQGHIYKPVERVPGEDQVSALKLPPGFRMEKWAENLGNPRIIAVAPDGAVYVTRRQNGDVVLLRDANRDGKADSPQVVAQKEGMHGIAIRGNQVYLATVKEVFVADRKPDGTLGELKTIISDLPDGGQHPNRTVALGPDGMLYITVGSTCNACAETNPESATILRAKPDGSSREIFASGLRNTIGFGWHPDTKQLYGWDHGIDWLGDNTGREEINRLEQGAKYGWPYVFADGKHNPADKPKDKTHEQWAKESRNPELMHTAHSAGMQWLFYTGDQFPAEYRTDAIVTLRGSWNRKPPSGYEVVRIRFQNGRPASVEPFISGFLVQSGGESTALARLCGLAQLPDGSLLIGDDSGGVIYRVSYQNPATSEKRPNQTGERARTPR